MTHARERRQRIYFVHHQGCRLTLFAAGLATWSLRDRVDGDMCAEYSIRDSKSADTDLPKASMMEFERFNSIDSAILLAGICDETRPTTLMNARLLSFFRTSVVDGPTALIMTVA